jgi:predicted transcriptional regulator/Zn-dependent protease
MQGWSLPVGKVFGVEVRLHSFFLLVLGLAVAWAVGLGGSAFRGVMLWALMLLAVFVREAARALAASWFAIELRSVLLLPTGGILAYRSTDAMKRMGEPRAQRTMALIGPLANIVFGFTLAGMVLALAPSVSLFSTRWVSPDHLLRAAVWVNWLLAAIHFLPVWPLDAGRVVQGEVVRAGDGTALRAFTRVGPAIALTVVACGLVVGNWWAIMAGLAMLLAAQVERQGLGVEASADTVRARDVMLAEYSVLSASATLEDAVVQARHTLQDVFPVVRAGNMVGAVGRLDVLQALEATGNGYVQGIMTRAFQTASPEDSLTEVLGRVTGMPGTSSQLVPVVVEERVVGIITPQNLQRSMGLLLRKSVPGARSAGAGSDAESQSDRDDERR